MDEDETRDDAEEVADNADAERFTRAIGTGAAEQMDNMSEALAAEVVRFHFAIVRYVEALREAGYDQGATITNAVGFVAGTAGGAIYEDAW